MAVCRVSHARGSAPPYRPLETRANVSYSQRQAQQEPRHSPLGDPRWRRRVRDRGPRLSGRSPAVTAQAKVNVLELEQPDIKLIQISGARLALSGARRRIESCDTDQEQMTSAGGAPAS
jgi:hypothetical protein